MIILDWEENGGGNGVELWVCRGRYGEEEPYSQLFHRVSTPQNSVINLEQHTHTSRTHKHCKLNLHTYCGNGLDSQTRGIAGKNVHPDGKRWRTCQRLTP